MKFDSIPFDQLTIEQKKRFILIRAESVTDGKVFEPKTGGRK